MTYLRVSHHALQKGTERFSETQNRGRWTTPHLTNDAGGRTQSPCPQACSARAARHQRPLGRAARVPDRHQWYKRAGAARGNGKTSGVSPVTAGWVGTRSTTGAPPPRRSRGRWRRPKQLADKCEVVARLSTLEPLWSLCTAQYWHAREIVVRRKTRQMRDSTLENYQHAHDEPVATSFAVGCSETSIRSSLAVPPAGPRVSMPGSADAILRKRAFTLKPALALVSMNSTPASLPLASPSSVLTCRRSTKSVLLPTSTTTTSLPRSALTSSTQRVEFTNEARSGQQMSK